MNVKKKTIVVTGAGNGIGRELTLLLLDQGASVAAVDINEAYLQETSELAGTKRKKLSTHVVNITDRQAVLSLPEEVLEAHGSIDSVINVAGIIQKFVKIDDMDFEAIERVMDINFWGTVNMTKAFLPYLMQRGEAHVVNISSMGGFLPVPGQSVYGASKAAVRLFTEGLHSELKNTNVNVSLVFPGAIATNIKANSGLAADDNTSNLITTPAKAAETIFKGMQKDKYHIFIGKDAMVMNILNNLLPKTAATLIRSQMKAHIPV